MTRKKTSPAETHMLQVLRSLGLPTEDENFQDTPKRFVKYLREFINKFDPQEVLGDGFTVEDGFHSMVVQSGIPFRGVCAHHLLPMVGHAAIGYVPRERVVGLSKLTRLVDAVGTELPGLQEFYCDKIADTLMGHLKPAGVIVNIHSEHMCMACRGVAEPDVVTSTTTVRGVFRDEPAARDTFYRLLRGARGAS